MIERIAATGQLNEIAASSQSKKDAALIKGQEKLSSLSDGDMVRGKVVSITESADGGRTASVDLGGGAVINAKLSGNMALREGQDVSFSVRGQAGGNTQMTLRPLYANTAADLSAMKALSQAGLAADADMTAMVREMMSEGMPVDRGTLLAMARNVSEFPGHATSVVQMTNLGIPVTGDNILQFENYKNFEHQIMDSIGSIMDELPEAFNAMRAGGDNAGALDMYGQLLELFSGKNVNGKPVQDPSQAGEAALKGPAMQQTGTGAEPVQEGSEAKQEGSVRLLQPLPLSEDHEGQNVKSPKAESPASEDAAGKANNTPKDPAEALAQALKARIGEENARAADSSARSVTLSGKGDTANAGFPEMLSKLGIPSNIIENALGKAPTAQGESELMKALADAFKKSAHENKETDEQWTRLFSSKEMGSLLKKAVERDWLLKPSDVENRENVKNLYDRLQNQTRTLAHILSSSSGSNTALSSSVNNLQNNLSFMNDLNHMFQYIQLPLKMNGNDTHGDLYVYANKKNAMHEDGTVSAVLHLDMEHMGPVDVFVKMRDNNVRTNFYLADDSVIDLVMGHIDMLNERLQKRGYNMEAKLQLKGEETPEDAPVSEMLGGNINRMSLLSQTSFDALA
ncbi:MAG: flagellar hook-length control protein FliK [Lachnospiraceae bacterium]|nr:flagellar hook-length control protein FliK [Lachnospiraceae bacterium]